MQTIKELESGELKGCTSLKLSERLTDFPVEIFTLADTLEYLDLSSNKLSVLPEDFAKLKKLKVFFCSDNEFTSYPQVLAECPLLEIVGFKANRIHDIPEDAISPNLRWLILTNNRVSALPKSIGKCYRLEKLMLAGNRLATLPDELQYCRSLALLRLSANQIETLPEWLFTMPKLSWLAFSGNPCGRNSVSEIEAPVIAYESLQIKDRLGEGASGTIYRASRDGMMQDVAVKVFKGNVTSDGYPEDEMNSSLEAGEHDTLVKILGVTDNIVESKTGLVMELIPKHYVNLGNPPSLKTCTRDVFDPKVSYSAKQILNILTSISSVANHLHERGIMHGDLYAHNMLIDDEGNTLFGDFGAATMYERELLTDTYSLERIEVSAFGYLVDDLLSLYHVSKNDDFSTALTSLKTLCLSPISNSRPNFEEIESILAKIKSGV